MPTRSAKSRGDRFAEVVLTPQEMGEADRATIAAGTPGIVLMERAGAAVAAAARRLWKGGPVTLLAGPGNNGGDGFVAARLLREAGFRVTVLLLADRGQLRGDAAEASARFHGTVLPAEASYFFGLQDSPPISVDDPAELAHRARQRRYRPGLIIDALFGAGVRLPLSEGALAMVRAVDGMTASLLAGHDTLTPRDRPVVLSVDLPTGVDGGTGAVAGEAIRADATITFVQRKPGHLLLPGRDLCGDVAVADIGIPPSVLDAIKPRAFRNTPPLWLPAWPRLDAETHKYTRGHAVVVSGPASATGAARLAAGAALRIGAGLVTVASPPAAILVNAGHLTAIMVRGFDGPDGLAALLGEKRVTAAVIGPGLGTGPDALPLIEAAIAADVALVLDADALSAFAAHQERLAVLLKARRRPVVLTPHDGEFARLFPDLAGGNRLDKARAAAARSGAVVISKGADTVVAAPDGRAAIADNAPPTLATAGTGDVLAGMVGGLLAQDMRAFEAASAAVWLHGEAAWAFGPGLIAEDLAGAVPTVLGRLLDNRP